MSAPRTVQIALIDRVNAQLSAPHSADLVRRLHTYAGCRWVPRRRQGQRTGEGRWSVPARHLAAVEAELTGAGWTVIVRRSR